MPALKVSGTTGQAPTTSYFGAIPDKFCLLTPGFNNSGVNAFTRSGFPSTGNFVSNWKVYNPHDTDAGLPNQATAIFGSNTTAPDGTNTGIHIAEGSANSIHAVQCVFSSSMINGGFNMRLSVFAKAAERTRFAMCVSDGWFDPNNSIGGAPGNTVRTVYDLAGGRVAVATNYLLLHGSQPGWTPVGSGEIIPFGNGWYKCSMDARFGQAGGGQASGIAIFIDNGSGLAAESTSYAGDGTSGVNFWRATMMPPAAWAMPGTQVFFDDFTTLNKIDLAHASDPTNTNLDTTKTWWVSTYWPNFGAPTDINLNTDPTPFSIVNGTQLKLAPTANNIDDYSIITSFWKGPGQLITDCNSSFVVQAPFLTECNCAWDPSIRPSGAGPTYWTTSLERFLNSDVPAQLITPYAQSGEVDNFEWQSGGRPLGPANSFFSFPMPAPFLGGTFSSNGTPIWQSTLDYNNNDVVFYLGTIYKALDANTGNIPSASIGVHWAVVTVSNAFYSPLSVDLSQFHIYSMLWVPNSADDVGHFLFFFDGAIAMGPMNTVGVNSRDAHVCYGPNFQQTPGDPTTSLASLTALNNNHWPLIWGTSRNINSFLDWAKVTK